MSKIEDNFYKTNDFIVMDDKYSKRLNVFNDYGYNFSGTKRINFDDEMLFKKTKTYINKDFLNIKR